MNFEPRCVARAVCACLVATALSHAHAGGNTALLAAPAVPGERLSAWLLRHAGPAADTTALQWRVDAEKPAQNSIRAGVVAALESDRSIALDRASRLTLADWLNRLPLTGRLPLASGDARWLEASVQDPVLAQGQQVLLPPRPRFVAVIGESGAPCLVEHRAGAIAQDYLKVCFGQQAAAVDEVWLAQPDGQFSRNGIAPWNLAAQDLPAPGAWIWAPGRDAGLPATLSDQLARFLATQLPAEFHPDLARLPRMSLAAAFEPAGEPRGPLHTANDWGEIGYLQTPSARMSGAGSVRFHVSRVSPYTRITTMLQPLDWFEAGFRYTRIAGVPYGPADFSGDQAYKDKSIDFKLRLKQEGARWPELALGMRDLGGTGLFSSEYLVASKRWGDWDASLGIAWGNLGARGNVGNPLSVFGDGFKTRKGKTGDITETGKANFGNMFHGPAALFGGVQWAPTERWVFKAELDGNNYQREAFGIERPARSPLNLGLVYRHSPTVDFSLGVERGNQLLAGITLHGRLDRLHAPKLLDPALPPVRPVAPVALPDSGWGGLVKQIELQTGWRVLGISEQNGSTELRAETDAALHLQQRIERAVTLLHASLPASSRRFVLKLQERDLPLSRIEIDRAEWVAQRTTPVPPALSRPEQVASPLASSPTVAAAGTWEAKHPPYDLQLAPSYRQILGGPAGFLLYEIGVQARFEQRFAPGTWLSGNVNHRLIDNYDNFRFDGTGELPPVRSLQRLYSTTSRTTLPLLQLTHVSDLGSGHYVSAYAGMFESMYGGVGGEWLYRPWRSRWAFGVDANHVRQRDFGQKLSFRDYSVDTGHASLYWDTGWNDLQLKLSAGRYLAGDVGATLDVRRTFSNGVAVGAWATKTNVSAQQFGEGSFDKGIYVSIPFDVMLPLSSPGAANIVWNPLTRDGGARLSRRYTLFDLTQQRGPRALEWQPAGQDAR